MPDNVEAASGSGGPTFATDQRASDSVHFPLVKLVWGALDTFTVVDTGAGAVPIADGGNSITVDSANLVTIAGAVSGTEMQVDVVAALPAGTNNIGDVDVLSVVPGTGATSLGKAIDSAVGATDTGVAVLAIRDDALSALTPIESDYVSLRVDANGALWTHDDALDAALAGSELQVDVVAALPAGTNSVGNVGIIPRTSGGMTIFRSLDIDETEEEIKATAGQVFSISAFNRTAAPLYLKFYNDTAVNVIVGTTAAVLTFVVPANADSDGAGFIWNNAIGFAFGTAITVACTTGVADSDTGAPGANDCVINVGYA